MRLRLTLAVAVLSAALWLVVWAAGGLNTWELRTVDTRFDVRGPRPQPSTVAVVAIDDRTLDEIGERPPLRRSHYAKVIDVLDRAGAKLIVLDIQITEETETDEDTALIEALDRARPTLLGSSETEADGTTNVLGGVEAQREFGVEVGNVNFSLDAGGIYRKVPYELDHLRSLAAVATRAEPFASRWIDYPGSVRTLSFIDVERGRAPDVKGRIVVVGASAPTLQDVHPTSASGAALISGAEIQASAIDTLLRGEPLRDAPSWTGALLIIVCACAVPLLGLKVSPLRVQALGLVLGAVALAGVQLAFGRGLIVPLVAPAGAFLCAAAGTLAVHYLVASAERERTHDLFARFVPEPVVRELLSRGNGRLLGGVRREGTVLFADLRGFTRLAERIEPDEVIEVLNRYLGELSDAIMAENGTLVSYLGDGIMAVFGAPLEQPDHADRALAAAREILETRLPRFNAWLGERGLSEPLGLGIGIASGDIMSGHVGSERRVEYAAVGDTTNVAARLEALTAEHGVQLLVSGTTRDRLREAADLQSVGELAVRGRSGRVSAWTLPAYTSSASV